MLEAIDTFPADEAAEMDAQQLAEQIDQQAVLEAANAEMRIADIGEISRSQLQAMVESGVQADETLVQLELAKLQSNRMQEIQGDTRARVANLPDGVAGLFDGEDIKLDTQYIKRGVFVHEGQHRTDGLDGQLDDALAPETGIREIDERLADFGTRRDILEERAMDAAGEIPEAYRETHWATVKDMEQRGRQAGVDMEAANSALIEAKDAEGYQEVLLELAVQEVAAENDEAGLDELQEAAEQLQNPTILRIIDETRDQYENGPEAARAQQYALSA